jgi:hypothetical protein
MCAALIPRRVCYPCKCPHCVHKRPQCPRVSAVRMECSARHHQVVTSSNMSHACVLLATFFTAGIQSCCGAMQLADISDWGSGAEVAKQLLPPGTTVQQFDVEKIERPPRDTRTIRGVVPTPALSIYKYVPPTARGLLLVQCPSLLGLFFSSISRWNVQQMEPVASALV